MRSNVVVALALILATVPAAAEDSQDDCGSGRDADRAPTGEPVLHLPSPGECLGHVGSGHDSYDVYDLVVGPHENVRVTLTVAPGMVARFSLMSFGSGEYRAWKGTYGDLEDVTDTASIDVHRLETGDVVQVFVKDRDTPGAYRLRVEPGPPPPAQDDCGSGTDAGHEAGTALAMPPRVDCVGRLAFGTDGGDRYTFDVVEGAGISVHFPRHGSTSASWCLLDPDGARLHCSAWASWEDDYHGFAAATGTYTVEVQAPWATSDYRMVVRTDGTATHHAGLVPFAQRVVRPVESQRPPHEGQGVDAQWVRLAHPTRASDVLHVTFDSPSNLFAGRHDGGISVHDDDGKQLASCAILPGFGLTWCAKLPVGATWVLVRSADLVPGPLSFEVAHVTYPE